MKLILLSLMLILSSIKTFAFDDYNTIVASHEKFRAQAVYLQNLLNTGDQKVAIEWHRGGGTSAYVEIFYDETGLFTERNSKDSSRISSKYLLGALLPMNSATRVRGEIFAYKLASLLGFGEIFGPGTGIAIKDKGFGKFKEEILKMQKEFSKHDAEKSIYKSKIRNISNLIKMMEEDNALVVAYSPWGPRPYDWDEVAQNDTHPLRKAIRNDEDMPDASLVIPAPKGVKDEILDPIRLSKDLSNAFLVDILNGQWDRFSGGNLQYAKMDRKDSEGNLKKEVRIFFSDNGGAFSYGNANRDRYFKKVSRFDHDVAQKLIDLNAFLKKEVASFENFDDEMKLRKFLEMSRYDLKGENRLSNPDTMWNSFKTTLSLLVEHINRSNSFL